MKVLVAGASGFLGKPILDDLLEHTELVGGVSRSGLRAPLKNPRFLELRADLRDPKQAKNALTARPWDAVVLALRSQNPGSQDRAVARVIGSAVSRAGLSFRVVLLSSAAVYGTLPAGSVDGFRETNKPNPDTDYGKTRAELEEVLRATLGERLLILRVFNATGLGEPRSLVTRSLMERIVAGEDPLRVRDADAARDFLDIRDVAAATRQVVLDSPPWDVLNVASGQGTTIGSLARMVTATGPRPVALVLDAGGRVSIGDPSRMLACGWFPRHTLAASLRQSWGEVLGG